MRRTASVLRCRTSRRTSNSKTKCNIPAIPASSAAASSGLIWGLPKDLPELPDFEFLRVPDEHRIYRLFFQEANYLQVLEGGIDPTHVMWLHSPYDLSDEEMNAQQPAQQTRSQ